MSLFICKVAIGHPLPTCTSLGCVFSGLRFLICKEASGNLLPTCPSLRYFFCGLSPLWIPSFANRYSANLPQSPAINACGVVPCAISGGCCQPFSPPPPPSCRRPPNSDYQLAGTRRIVRRPPRRFDLPWRAGNPIIVSRVAARVCTKAPHRGSNPGRHSVGHTPYPTDLGGFLLSGVRFPSLALFLLPPLASAALRGRLPNQAPSASEKALSDMWDAVAPSSRCSPSAYPACQHMSRLSHPLWARRRSKKLWRH